MNLCGGIGGEDGVKDEDKVRVVTSCPISLLEKSRPGHETDDM
jgi:hypothetical protein